MTKQWSIPVMEPAAYHLLTAIFVGWLEPVPEGERVIFLADLDADEYGFYHLGGALKPTTTNLLLFIQSELRDLLWGLQMEGYGYESGAVIEGYHQPATAITDARFLVRHVMPVNALGEKKDCIQIAVRRVEMIAAFAGQSFKHIEPLAQVPFMSNKGVLDEAKLDAVARDLGVKQLILCNNQSFWQVDQPPHSISGMTGPGWTSWCRPNIKDDF